MKKVKYLKINKGDIVSDRGFTIDTSKSIPYKYFYRKIGKTVYVFTKVGNQDWEMRKSVYHDIPFVEWHD